VIGAVVVAAVMRAWCVAEIPLTVTNDGMWYLMWARRILAHEDGELAADPDAGIPLFLAGVFGVGGVGPMAVLIAQHLLGCLAAA